MAAPALSASVTPYDAGASIAAAAFLGETPAFALDDGNVLLITAQGPVRVAAHPGASILVAAASGKQFVTGGDGGRVVAVSANGAIQEIAEEKGRWIDALAIRGDGAIAWSSGKNVRARD